MTFRLSFQTDNSAFDGNDRAAEIARILREVAEQIERAHGGPVRDINGNIVGKWEIVS